MKKSNDLSFPPSWRVVLLGDGPGALFRVLQLRYANACELHVIGHGLLPEGRRLDIHFHKSPQDINGLSLLLCGLSAACPDAVTLLIPLDPSYAESICTLQGFLQDKYIIFDSVQDALSFACIG